MGMLQGQVHPVCHSFHSLAVCSGTQARLGTGSSILAQLGHLVQGQQRRLQGALVGLPFLLSLALWKLMLLPSFLLGCPP